MRDRRRVERFELRVGGLSCGQLMIELSSRGIQLNGHAETLLEDVVHDGRAAQTVVLTERTVADLGFPTGATLSGVFEAARRRGLQLCPADTGPYLRLALTEQAESRDSVMSAGRAPEGALTVAAEPLSEDDEYPKGFYLRVVDGQAWLRGYRCDDEHRWSPEDRFLFQLAPTH
ncbi:hypothetical protein BJH93_12025 [Kocuria polaris]|nr:hypothetical protein [Kocuria polaris]